jgi:integrase
MHRRPFRHPGYLHHKPSNQAYVRIDGRMIYLGVYDSPDSHRRYAELIGDLQAGVDIGRSRARRAPRPITVGELAEQYLEHEASRFGPTNKQTYAAKYAMLALVERHAGLRAEDFRPKALRRIQTDLVEQNYARREVNERINRIRRAFQWAVAEELIPESVWACLKAVTNVRAGEARDNPPRTPADPELVDQTVRWLLANGRPGAAHLIQFLRWTGCRPSEGCQATLGDLDRNTIPPRLVLQNHKTRHQTGAARVIPLNARAMQAAEAGLANATHIGPDAPLFRSTRGKAFTANGLYQAVRTACRAMGKETWAPYQLRHLVATEAMASTGNEAATAAMLGHTPSSTVVRRYSRDREKLAAQAALAIDRTSA